MSENISENSKASVAPKVFVPPIKIQGIKTKLVPMIKALGAGYDDTLWIEPFMGSGVVGFNAAHKKALFADTNPYIIEFYQGVKTQQINSRIIRTYLEEQGAMLERFGDEYYHEVRTRFNKMHEPLDFLFLNRSCFNGMVRFNRNGEFNVPFGHKAQRFSKAYITKIVNQVSHLEWLLERNDWDFVCQPFEKTIAMASNAPSFIYCDPPYLGRHVDYFDSWDENKDDALHDALVASGATFMLSTWKGNEYRTNTRLDTVWGFCHKSVMQHFYYVGAKETNRHPITEALLTNYVPR